MPPWTRDGVPVGASHDAGISGPWGVVAPVRGRGRGETDPGKEEFVWPSYRDLYQEVQGLRRAMERHESVNAELVRDVTDMRGSPKTTFVRCKECSHLRDEGCICNNCGDED